MIGFIRSIQARDPAHPTFLEVVLAYPGFHVMGTHRLAGFFWRYRLRALARFISHIGRLLTGIEIHPAAKIGKRLFVDHGMGVVIGETAEIGNDVLLYHGVTLGGRGDEKHGKRHPTIENDVMIGSGAKVLGNIVIGEGARIGSSAVVTKSVPAGCTAVGNPARLVNCMGQSASYGLPGDENPDPVGEIITNLLEDVHQLRKEVASLRGEDDDEENRVKRRSRIENWKGDAI